MPDYTSDCGNLINFIAQLINLRAQIKYFERPINITPLLRVTFNQTNYLVLVLNLF
jgi:hypothetical protein